MVKWFVEDLKVDFFVVNVNGYSALYKCAIYGYESVIDYLFELKIELIKWVKFIILDDRN